MASSGRRYRCAHCDNPEIPRSQFYLYEMDDWQGEFYGTCFDCGKEWFAKENDLTNADAKYRWNRYTKACGTLHA